MTASGPGPTSFVANLPYNTGVPFFFNVLEQFATVGPRSSWCKRKWLIG